MGGDPSATAEALPHALQLWDNAARMATPVWLKAWLGFLILCFLGSLLFVRRHAAARVALAGLVASHALVLAIELGELATLRRGLVSVTHVVGWLPVAVVLARELGVVSAASRYGQWCRLLLAVLCIALLFDLRDAGMYLYYGVRGHPALFGP